MFYFAHEFCIFPCHVLIPIFHTYYFKVNVRALWGSFESSDSGSHPFGRWSLPLRVPEWDMGAQQSRHLEFTHFTDEDARSQQGNVTLLSKMLIQTQLPSSLLPALSTQGWPQLFITQCEGWGGRSSGPRTVWFYLLDFGIRDRGKSSSSSARTL